IRPRRSLARRLIAVSVFVLLGERIVVPNASIRVVVLVIGAGTVVSRVVVIVQCLARRVTFGPHQCVRGAIGDLVHVQTVGVGVAAPVCVRVAEHGRVGQEAGGTLHLVGGRIGAGIERLDLALDLARLVALGGKGGAVFVRPVSRAVVGVLVVVTVGELAVG